MSDTADRRVHLSHEDYQWIHKLRRESPALTKTTGAIGLGDRISDKVAAAVGSWRFIIIQTMLLFIWIVLNVIAYIAHWDPYPFILLNLILSFQAAYTAPVIMMSQNRQADIDRQHAEHDYRVNVKAELEIELLHHKIDLLREQEIARLTRIIERLSDHLAPDIVAEVRVEEAKPAGIPGGP